MSADQKIAARLDWIAAIREPTLALGWDLERWQYVIRLSRRLRLLARLAESLDAAGLLAEIAERPRRHLIAEMRLSRWRIRAVTWALDRIGAELGGCDYPWVLLKGAAYLAQGLPIAAGRIPADIDILVPREHLDDAQARLRGMQWAEIELDEHDQRYYREWSHELPPMRHPTHPIELDVHHNILPPVARTTVDARLLLSRIKPSKWPRWHVLDPVDQVLHSAAHLFHDSVARDRIRDLVDIDGLLRHFGEGTCPWNEILSRAAELGLIEPLSLACQFCCSWLRTSVPSSAREQLARAGASRVRQTWLLPLLSAVLAPPADPEHPRPQSVEIADAIFLARYHFSRLPTRLLVPHLVHKLALRRPLTGRPSA
jgi:hypothetical protein